jgi:hypothetical protein
VNVEDDYHEEHRELSSAAAGGGDHLVPGRITKPTIEEALAEIFAKYDSVALGSALGSVAGILAFLATAILLIKGGHQVGQNLSLLGNYLLGYEVSWAGAFLGLFEAGIGGFGFGWVLASLINAVIDREERYLLDRVMGMRSMNLFEGDER